MAYVGGDFKAMLTVSRLVYIAGIVFNQSSCTQKASRTPEIAYCPAITRDISYLTLRIVDSGRKSSSLSLENYKAAFKRLRLTNHTIKCMIFSRRLHREYAAKDDTQLDICQFAKVLPDSF